MPTEFCVVPFEKRFTTAFSATALPPAASVKIAAARATDTKAMLGRMPALICAKLTNGGRADFLLPCGGGTWGGVPWSSGLPHLPISGSSPRGAGEEWAVASNPGDPKQ